MEVNILAEEKPRLLKLADGNEYLMPVFDLTTLANMEAIFGFSLRQFGEELDKKPMQTLQVLVFALLKENHPELTKEQAGRLVTLKEIPLITEALKDILSLLH